MRTLGMEASSRTRPRQVNEGRRSGSSGNVAPFRWNVSGGPTSVAPVPVYVDDARIPWRGLRWSHMVADTAEELYLAAEELGLSRERVQAKGRTLHYDLPE